MLEHIVSLIYVLLSFLLVLISCFEYFFKHYFCVLFPIHKNSGIVYLLKIKILYIPSIYEKNYDIMQRYYSHIFPYFLYCNFFSCFFFLNHFHSVYVDEIKKKMIWKCSFLVLILLEIFSFHCDGVSFHVWFNNITITAKQQ